MNNNIENNEKDPLLEDIDNKGIIDEEDVPDYMPQKEDEQPDLTESGIDLNYYRQRRQESTPEELFKSTQKASQMFAHLLTEQSTLLAKRLAQFDMNKIELKAIEGEIDLDQKIRIGEDTIVSVRDLIEDFNNRADKHLSVDPDIKNGIQEAIGDLLYEKGKKISPTTRLLIYGGLMFTSLSMMTYSLYSQKQQLLEIIKENKSIREEYQNKIKELEKKLKSYQQKEKTKKVGRPPKVKKTEKKEQKQKQEQEIPEVEIVNEKNMFMSGKINNGDDISIQEINELITEKPENDEQTPSTD